MPYDTDNIFAKILRGDIPCTKLHDDAFALAFPDIRPQASLHILVIPKGAYLDATDFGANATPEEITGFWRAVASVAQAQGLTADGYRLISNAGANAHQEVPHFHVHLLGGRELGPMLAQS